MTYQKDDLKEAIKLFLYLPMKVGEEHNVFCACGKRMKLKFSGSSFRVGDCGFECECGNKILFAWECVNKFPTPYDKIELVITEKKWRRNN